MSLWLPLGAGALALALTGCGKPEKTAAESLREAGYGQTAEDFLLAAEAGDVEAIRLFHETGLEIDATDGAGDTALMRASAIGGVDLVDMLLGLGADPAAKNAKGRTPLMFAAEGGRAEIVRRLLAKGASSGAENADAEGWSALKLAAYHGHAATVELLASRVRQAALDQALLVACSRGEVTSIASLLKYGAYPNTRSAENLTPLMIAAQAGHVEAAKTLLRNQANPYALDDHENTAANLATAAGHAELGEWLLDPAALVTMAATDTAAPSIELVGAGARGKAVHDTLAENLAAGSAGPSPKQSVSGASDTLMEGSVAKDPATSRQSNPAASQTATSPLLARPVLTVPASGGRHLASINGRTIASRAVTVGGPVKSLKMNGYREAPISVILKSVEPKSHTAQVRVLSNRNPEPVTVREGETIPGTTYRVKSLDNRFISSKLGNGHLSDVSRMLVEDTRSGSRHLLLKDVPGRSSDTYATLILPGSPFEYVVKNGDIFRAATAEGGEQDYEVLEVRPTQVVIRNVSTDETMTVNRDGLAMR